ncbi:hypothetical protein EVAR_55374_1 [Eumeta japonica]|uniref:Uncharacterized protein n=1 Tax=Eumeta variegata TaxID=151549 RepID=A0A4C1YSQ9_EUMVA|nr:hypothetical protein EVAR_55374_1 [Eumeta japonica]
MTSSHHIPPEKLFGDVRRSPIQVLTAPDAANFGDRTRTGVFSVIRNFRQRPYHAEYTGSRPITEVKQRRARSVLGWVTAWEHRVTLAPYFLNEQKDYLYPQTYFMI